MSAGWLRLQFRVDASYFDTLSDVLEGCLALAVSIENAGEDEFFEVAFPGKPTWEKICVSALFHDDVDSQAIIDFVNNTLFPTQPAPVIVEKMQDQDWERVWLDQYQPIHVSNDLWIVPSWLEAPEPLAVNLKIDPGLAFGTGTHATTFLCLEWIANHDFSDTKNIIDYGAGSGILAIASLLKGGESAIAVDIDPLAVQAANDNGVMNSVSDKMSSEISVGYETDEKYQLVIANILAEVLIEKADFLLRLLADNGTLLLSGILDSQLALVKDHFSSIEPISVTVREKDNWLMLIVAKDGKN